MLLHSRDSLLKQFVLFPAQMIDTFVTALKQMNRTPPSYQQDKCSVVLNAVFSHFFTHKLPCTWGGQGTRINIASLLMNLERLKTTQVRFACYNSTNGTNQKARGYTLLLWQWI